MMHTESEKPEAPSVAAIIPVLNEAVTIGDVVDVARAATLVNEVIVVDNGSEDDTRAVAEAHGARVVDCPVRGKGEAMSIGVQSTRAAFIVFLDGDLTDLQPRHVDRMVQTVLDKRADMSCGLFDRGPRLNPLFLHALPIFTGQRAMPRELFESLSPDEYHGYKVEAALNVLCREEGLRMDKFVCDGMFHRTKEQKYANPVLGWVRKQAMLAVATGSYAGFWGRRRLTRSRTRTLRALRRYEHRRALSSSAEQPD